MNNEKVTYPLSKKDETGNFVLMYIHFWYDTFCRMCIDSRLLMCIFCECCSISLNSPVCLFLQYHSGAHIKEKTPNRRKGSLPNIGSNMKSRVLLVILSCTILALIWLANRMRAPLSKVYNDGLGVAKKLDAETRRREYRPAAPVETKAEGKDWNTQSIKLRANPSRSFDFKRSILIVLWNDFILKSSCMVPYIVTRS